MVMPRVARSREAPLLNCERRRSRLVTIEAMCVVMADVARRSSLLSFFAPCELGVDIVNEAGGCGDGRRALTMMSE